MPFLHKRVEDQEAGDDEENIDTTEAATDPFREGMKTHDREHGDRAEVIDIGAVLGVREGPGRSQSGGNSHGKQRVRRAGRDQAGQVRISVNVTGDFGIVTDLKSCAGLREEVVGIRVVWSVKDLLDCRWKGRDG